MTLKIFVYLIKVMNKKQKKLAQKKYANLAFNDYFSFLNSLDENELKLEKLYVKELIKLQTSFNLKLSKEIKLQLCKKCLTYHPIHKEKKTLLIRLNSKTKTKNYICKNCGYTKRIPYK